MSTPRYILAASILLAACGSQNAGKIDAGGMICRSGKCYPTICAGNECLPGKGCIDNVCVFPQCVGVQCTSDQVCAIGRCYPRNCTFGDCPEGSLCASPCSDELVCPLQCVQDVCVGITCGPASTCVGGVCVAPTCDDSIKNGDETDVDCGGTVCGKCPLGKFCIRASDCEAGGCSFGRCATNTCGDNIKNGDETDVDCGGSCPNKCRPNQRCLANADCMSLLCDSDQTCKGPRCDDKVLNGDETDVDCGGTCATCDPKQPTEPCRRCATGSPCKVANDCYSLTCTADKCG